MPDIEIRPHGRYIRKQRMDPDNCYPHTQRTIPLSEERGTAAVICKQRKCIEGQCGQLIEPAKGQCITKERSQEGQCGMIIQSVLYPLTNFELKEGKIYHKKTGEEAK